MNYSFIMLDDNITLFISDRNPIKIFKDDEPRKFEEILRAIAQNNIEDIIEICAKNYNKEFVDKIENQAKTGFLSNNEDIPQSLANVIKLHAENGIDTKPLVNFFKRISDNPSYHIRNQLFDFICACNESTGFTINHLGNIVAFKRVRSDYKDIYTGTMDNSIGKIVEMDRYLVDDNPNMTCSNGLHFCAFSYLINYGGAFSNDDKVIIVEINPRDVVAIPTDYKFAKGRCCKYKVIGEVDPTEINNMISDKISANLVFNAEDDDDDDEYKDDYDENYFGGCDYNDNYYNELSGFDNNYCNEHDNMEEEFYAADFSDFISKNANDSLKALYKKNDKDTASNIENLICRVISRKSQK